MEVSAYAKLNLSLDILCRREDGYHELKMVMHTVGLHDTLRFTPLETRGIKVRSDLAFLPNNEKNLAAQAALRFWAHMGTPKQGWLIELNKQIPVCAGMAGGSSDAAAVLRALNERLDAPLDWQSLARIGAEVGSDVPYCVLGGTALAEGRGERLTPLAPLPPCWFVLCKPDFAISTPELFSKVNCAKIRCRPDTNGLLAALERGDLPGVARRMYNVFEDVLPSRRKGEIQAIKATLIEYGALGAVMSGSGPTVFGVFTDEREAEAAFRALREDYAKTYLTQSVRGSW